ncbi:MAG: alpha/beta hydrolase [Acidobacteria bacterium]|nr:alpha/beta hydrolase [Acidobacteriota bacterium]
MPLYVERIPAAAAGPTLVFLHHGLGCVPLWRDFPARLTGATGLPALLYDREGHGRSPALAWPRACGYLEREADVLCHLLHQEHISDFILLGHSDGGSIALLYAALSNARPPRGVISEAAHLFVEDITRAGIRRTVDSYRAGLREKLMRYHGEKTDALFWSWAGLWLAPSFDAFDIRARLGEVRCPVLALQGADDEYGTAAQLEAIAASVSGPVETLLIPSSGHEPHSDAFETAFEAMRTVIALWK